MYSSKIITLSDSLFISVFSIIAVFFVLLVISYLIDLTAKALSLRKSAPAASKPLESAGLSRSASAANGVDPMTAAIIGSVIDAYEKGRNYKIKSIK